MEEITLNHEEWFKIYMLLDTPNNEVDFNKNFLLFAEYFKLLSRDVMTVYVSSVESLAADPKSELGQFFAIRDGINVSELTDEEKVEKIKKLEEEYSEVLNEYKLQNQEVTDIVTTPFTITAYKIPRSLIPDIPDEFMEVLQPIIKVEEIDE